MPDRLPSSRENASPPSWRRFRHASRKARFGRLMEHGIDGCQIFNHFSSTLAPARGEGEPAAWVEASSEDGMIPSKPPVSLCPQGARQVSTDFVTGDLEPIAASCDAASTWLPPPRRNWPRLQPSRRGRSMRKVLLDQPKRQDRSRRLRQRADSIRASSGLRLSHDLIDSVCLRFDDACEREVREKSPTSTNSAA